MGLCAFNFPLNEMRMFGDIHHEQQISNGDATLYYYYFDRFTRTQTHPYAHTFGKNVPPH